MPILSALGLLVALPAASALPSPPPPTIVDALEWRNIGPSRGGRVVAVAGVPGQPLVYYFGGTGGGVFKTTDAGGSWNPMTSAPEWATPNTSACPTTAGPRPMTLADQPISAPR